MAILSDPVASLPRKRYLRAGAGPLQGVRVLDLTRLVSGAQFGVLPTAVELERARRDGSFVDRPYYRSAKRLLA